MVRFMLYENNYQNIFWAKALNVVSYIMNRALLRPFISKIAFELIFGKGPYISYFKCFSCKCFILNTHDHLGKFDKKSDEGIFLGYSSNKKAYRVHNKRTLVVEESIHVSFDESNIHNERNGDEEEVFIEGNDPQDKNFPTKKSTQEEEEKHDDRQHINEEEEKDDDRQHTNEEEEETKDLPRDWKHIAS